MLEKAIPDELFNYDDIYLKGKQVHNHIELQ